MQRILSFVPIVVVGFLFSCIEDYPFNPQSFEKVLVVDASFTDEAKTHLVRLSYTFPIEDKTHQPLEGAEVWVESGAGDRIIFNETEKGIYASPHIKGQVGETYKLFITAPNGEKYTSDAVELIASPPIDNLYGRYAELPSDESNQNQGGVQFFLDTQDTSGKARHFRYEWEEVYKIQVPYPSEYEVVGEELLKRAVNVGACYKGDSSKIVLVGTSKNSSSIKLIEFPLRFVDQREQQLRVRYSLLARQYAISENAYIFYKKLKENNESAGSLFDKQTGTIAGNIQRIDDPDQIVLGYFEVSGVSIRRAFFSPTDFDEKFIIPAFPSACPKEGNVELVGQTEDEADSTAISAIRAAANLEVYQKITRSNLSTGNVEWVITLNNKTCTSCDWYANPDKPDFWID